MQAEKSPFVSVIMPARNEADKIGLTIKSLIENKPEEIGEAEIVVVDDASNDETSEEAKKAGATKVVKLSRHRGKGSALRFGVEGARGEILLFIDADLGETAKSLWQILKPIIDDEADMTIAAPPPDPEGGGFGFVKRFSAWAIKTLAGFEPKAPLSGQRALKRSLLKQIRIANGYAVETAMTIDALKAGFRVKEVPIVFGHRTLGKSWRGFIHRAKQFWDIFWAVLLRLLKR
ncbi:MAG: glycosyltransferase family 2 protein [Armatimonadetes bacterium]|nr:glycosyltransferase family 2 protein [Armatimonadota bacterium]MDW8028860.1 glycosyltransferase family 2 protein [Armatimonadota bacterium]